MAGDDALVREMLRSTAMMFIGMQKGPLEVKSVMRGEMIILDILLNKNGAALPGELSSIMDVSSAGVAIALKSLEKKGYIERNIDKTDRRKILVTITGEGREFVIKQRKRTEDKMRLIIDEIGEQDVREYIRIVGRIVEIFQGHE